MFVESITPAENKPAYAADSGRCAVHATKLEKEEEAIAGGCVGAALQIGFNALAGVLNLEEHEFANSAPFSACITDPQLRFNPQSEKNPTLEPERLQKLTNMANASTTEVEGKAKPNGADIHPTPAGYKELAMEMLKERGKCKTEGLPGF